METAEVQKENPAAAVAAVSITSKEKSEREEFELAERKAEDPKDTIEEALKSTTKAILTIPITTSLRTETTNDSKISILTNHRNHPPDRTHQTNDISSNQQDQYNENIPEIEANSEEDIIVDARNTTVISINDSLTPEAVSSTSTFIVKAEEPQLGSPIEAKTAKQLFKEKAAEHGGDDSVMFLQQETSQSQQQHQLALAAQAKAQAAAQQRTRTLSNNVDVTISRNPSTAGKHEKKIGHRRIDDEGEVTYKKIQSKQIMGSIQLGIQQTVGSLASKPKRDLLMNDFWEMETISFPSEGSSITPAHHYNDFRFKVYAPIAFRYFRDLFGIAPEDFLMSMCSSPLRQLSNPGASGSLFYLTDDDEFIIKTVQKKECEFLQKLLPGYYMNLSQNPRTLLPKFFGLYCFHYNAKNVRLVAMNNLLPSDIKMHAKYDLKGSTFRRKASKAERQKASPTYKDLDFMEHHPSGIFLETDKYNALMKTIQRDCMVLESFQIMDYSLLVGIHNLDLAAKEKREERIRNARAKLQKPSDDNQIPSDSNENDSSLDYQNANANQTQNANHNQISTALTNALGVSGGIGGGSAFIGFNPLANQASTSSGAVAAAAASAAPSAGTSLNRTRSMNRQRLVAHSTAMESITANLDVHLEEDDEVPAGGIPARSENDERLILYIGIIDILQSYRLEKKLEHTFKSIIYNGDTVSVCRPSFYAQRFQNFMGKNVFKKTPTFPLKHSPSKRKTSTLSNFSAAPGGIATSGGSSMNRTPQRTPSHSISSPPLALTAQGTTTPSLLLSRQLHHLSGMSTPPPAFDDIDEEDITATSSSNGHLVNHLHQQHQFNENAPSSYSNSNKYMTMRSYVSSNPSLLSSNTTDDFSNDDDDDDEHEGERRLSSSSPMIRTSKSYTIEASSITKSPKLTKTKVQVTTIGCSVEEDGGERENGSGEGTIVNRNHIYSLNHNHDDHDSGNDMSSSTDTPKHIKQTKLLQKIEKYEIIQASNDLHQQHPEDHAEHTDVLQMNGSRRNSTTKTTIINTQAQTFTSTLVVNDIQR